MFTLAGLCSCWMGDINGLAPASVSGQRGPPPAEWEKSRRILSHRIWQEFEICGHYARPTINLVLFEKPALDGRKLAPGKGNNLILSNLVEAGKYCNPFCTQQSCERARLCLRLALVFKFVVASSERILVHMHLLPSETKAEILISPSFVEIVHIAFSAEVPIGAFSQSW